MVRVEIISQTGIEKNNDFVTEFIFINQSPNRKTVDEKQQEAIDFDLCKCFYCATLFEQFT